MGPNEMVYIVDDDTRVGEALSTLLRAIGKNVRSFSSGRDFLDFERKDSCACLILDLKMPELNGLEVQKLISTDTTIPVIFITGRGETSRCVMSAGRCDLSPTTVDCRRGDTPERSGYTSWSEFQSAVMQRA